MTPYLHLENLGKRFGPTIAVDSIDLTVDQGEFISLLGPSGCGKTTTLQMIAGFTEPSAGRILLQGRDLTPIAPERRGLGIVFQSYALFPHMTVAQNVAFGLEMRRVDAGARRRRVQDALELVHLGQHAGRYPRELSGGQRQRVALARALVIAPPLLLLDEPLSNLDAKLREEMQGELRSIQRKVGTTTIMVTHDQAEALAISDRIVLLNQGRIVRIDAPHTAYEDPRHTFAAHFIGHTNLISGHIESRPSGIVLTANGSSFNLPPDTASRAGATFSLRPERIRVVASGAGRLNGRVEQRMFHGNHWVLTVRTGLGNLQVFLLNDGIPTVTEGDTVDLDWGDDALRPVEENV
ncbi:MAG: ABC transporter ATP-binding protein [Burkholderiales bacterium]|nr:ABC transporter ATP-binding protein [Burkholderiales bacterium]MDE2610547.1 ABC transporter ATP-binding protein [Burkholderiales bacterium]